MLNGDTADIFPFRFTFWEPVKFLDHLGFPESRWTMGRFLGIAWDTGDLFTFKIWSEPDGKWQNGREFTRSVVQKHDESKISLDTPELLDLSQFWFQRMYKPQKRKHKNELIYELRDAPETKERIGDATILIMVRSLKLELSPEEK